MIRHLIGFVLILGSGALVYLLALPAWANIQTARVATSNLAELIVKTQKLAEISQSVTEVYRSLNKSDIAIVDELVPDKIDNVKLILELQQLAEQFGLTVRQIDGREAGSEVIDGYSVNSVAFGATLEGEYQDFVQFLEQLELSRRLIDPISISFQAIDQPTSETSGDQGLRFIAEPDQAVFSGYTYNVSFVTYWKG